MRSYLPTETKNNILSQNEIEYLRFPKKFESDYSYVLKNKIKNKVEALNKELALLERAEFLGFTDFNKVTEFSKTSKDNGTLENGSFSQKRVGLPVPIPKSDCVKTPIELRKLR